MQANAAGIKRRGGGRLTDDDFALFGVKKPKPLTHEQKLQVWGAGVKPKKFVGPSKCN